MTVRVGPLAFDHVLYDSRGDVLYLSLGTPQEAADSVVTPEGHLIRYGQGNAIIGITFVNAKWLMERDGALSVTPSSLPITREDLGPGVRLAVDVDRAA